MIKIFKIFYFFITRHLVEFTVSSKKGQKHHHICSPFIGVT